MDNKQKSKVSKFLSFVLRHKPEHIGLTLDSNGWVLIEELLEACATNGHTLSRRNLEEVVAESDKQRFRLSADGLSIRASQGHSIEVDLGYEAKTPPALLFHGTAKKNLPSIEQQGLSKQRRHHVHLSSTRKTAQLVGRRHGSEIVLHIDAVKMHEDGYSFFLSDNEVWLTEAVPPQYISWEEDP